MGARYSLQDGGSGGILVFGGGLFQVGALGLCGHDRMRIHAGTDVVSSRDDGGFHCGCYCWAGAKQEMTKITISNQSRKSKRKYKSENGRTLWRTSEYIRGGIKCHGGVSIPCRPVASAVRPISNQRELTLNSWTKLLWDGGSVADSIKGTYTATLVS
jgi:hypothetical protein